MARKDWLVQWDRLLAVVLQMILLVGVYLIGGKT